MLLYKVLKCTFITASTTEKQDIQQLLEDIPKLSKHFTLHYRVGEGTFSNVYLATLKNDSLQVNKFAVKHVVPTCHPERIRFELKCLQSLGYAIKFVFTSMDYLFQFFGF